MASPEHDHVDQIGEAVGALAKMVAALLVADRFEGEDRPAKPWGVGFRGACPQNLDGNL
jgi:hypothetical protein